MEGMIFVIKLDVVNFEDVVLVFFVDLNDFDMLFIFDELN